MENTTVKTRGKAGRPKKEKPDKEIIPKIKLFDRHKYARNQKLQEDDTDDEDIIINLNEEQTDEFGRSKEVKVLEVRRKKKRPERVRAGIKAPPRPEGTKSSPKGAEPSPEGTKSRPTEDETKPEGGKAKPDAERTNPSPERAKSDAERAKSEPIGGGYTSAGESNGPVGDSGNLSDSSKLRQKLMIKHYPSGPSGYNSYGNPYNKFNPNQQYLIF